MDNKLSIEEVKNILQKEPPMLFLGAGFSLGATNEYGDIPLGNALKMLKSQHNEEKYLLWQMPHNTIS